jgi:dipeptidyl aminopeptidase/acylaminoacyl peptidase
VRLGTLSISLSFMVSVLSGSVVLAEDQPSTIIAEGVPPIPPRLDKELDRYRFHQSSVIFEGWAAGERKLLVKNVTDGPDQIFLLDKPGGELTQLTRHDETVLWATANPSSNRFVFASDNCGDENNHLFLYDVETGSTRRFANGSFNNRYPLWSHSGRRLAYSSSARNGADLDLYLINPPIVSSRRLLKETKGSLVATSWSPDDRRLAAVEYVPDFTESRVHLIDVATGDDVALSRPPGRPTNVGGVLWSRDGNSLYWLTDRDSEFYHLARYDLASGRETSLTASIPWDVGDFDLSDDGTAIVLVANEDGRSILRVLDAPTGEERPAPRFARGVITNLMFRPNSHEFAFQWQCSRVPGGVFSYDLDSGQQTRWVKPSPCGPKAGSVDEPELVRYPSFDGRMIPAFVRRTDRKFGGRRPVLIEVHGGPSSQSKPVHSGLDDYLIGEFGLTIIAPNVRGSTGYGRSYEKLDNGFLREDSVKDVGSLLDWIANQPDLDSSRVAVSGGSYGGYLALASLVQYGDRLSAGIDWMGFSDFETFLESPRPLGIAWHRDEFGDERDPKMREFLVRISPRRNAAKIRKPLLIMHGSNDPRVGKEESEQIAAEVRKNGTPVWSILFDGEGHGLELRDHAVYYQHAQILFLKRYLLGEGL